MTTTIFKNRCLKQKSLKQRRRRPGTSRRRTKSSFFWCARTFAPTSHALSDACRSSSEERHQGAADVALHDTMPVRHTAFRLPKTCHGSRRSDMVGHGDCGFEALDF